MESADSKVILFNCLKNVEVKVKEIFDLANTTNEGQIKGEEQLKCLTESVEFISAPFEEYEADRKKNDEMINSLEQKVLGLTEKVNKLSSLVDRQEQYSMRNCILIHGVKENQNEDTDEVVNKLKSEMNLEISPGDIDRTHRIGVPSNGKNRPITVKFVRYLKRRSVFTNKKRRLKGKNISITKSLTKIRMSALKEARNKFGYSSVWTADGKIMYKDKDDTTAKAYFD